MPSRVAVDGDGDAYVANRGFNMQGTVTKIALEMDDCVDRNDSGSIETSTSNEPMPWGEDECILWNAPVGAPNSVLRAIAIDLGDANSPQGYPWAGGFESQRVYKLSPATGEVLLETTVPVQPYGAIVLPDGKLWLSSISSGAMVWVDTLTGEVGEPIPYPTGMRGGCAEAYGMTADTRGRLWFSGWTCRDGLGYDTHSGEWTRVDTTAYGLWAGRGITVDARGRIWMAMGGDGDSHLALWEADAFVAGGNITPPTIRLLRMPPGHQGPSGIGADGQGNLWLAHHVTSQLVRIDLETLEMASYTGPNRVYTYSDFSGSVRRTIIGRGTYQDDIDAGCPDPLWSDLTWDAELPEGSSVSFTTRSAPTVEELEEAPPIDAGFSPGDEPPIDLASRFGDANVNTHQFMRVQMTLEATDLGESPVAHSFRVEWFCPE